MLLSDGDLRKELDAGRLVLDPWDESMLQPSSVDVRLDRFFRVFQNSRYTHIDPREEQDELTTLLEPEGDDPFVLHPGEFVLGSTFEAVSLPDDLAGRLEGKALAVDTSIPTPAGWRTMGDLLVGEQVFGADGRPTRVVAATEIMLDRPCYEVCFSDGQSIVADSEHRWLTSTKTGRAAVTTTAEVAATVRVGGEYRHHVALAEPVEYPAQALPVDPYVLGSWLGDGTSDEARDEIRSAGGVPRPYLEASIQQRLALLQGLMDSGGDVDEKGRCTFVDMREGLSDAVVELAAGLGLCPVTWKGPVTCGGVDRGVAHQVTFTSWLPVFRLGAKAARLKDIRCHRRRAIVATRPILGRPVRCIQVSAPDGMFLAGSTFIPTHNSSLGRLGLLTHSTAGFIDPGFSGHITLELSNVANLPITLWPGMKIGQLCLFRLSSPAERPYGSAGVGSRYQGQRGPTPSRAHLNFHQVQTRRR